MAKKENNIDLHLTFRVVLTIVIFMNLSLGFFGLLGETYTSKAISLYFGSNINLTSEMSYVIKILSVYMLTIGIMGIFAWIAPKRNEKIIMGISILLILRVFEKIAFANSIQETFGLTNIRLWIGNVIYLILAFLLFYLRPRN